MRIVSRTLLCLVFKGSVESKQRIRSRGTRESRFEILQVSSPHCSCGKAEKRDAFSAATTHYGQPLNHAASTTFCTGRIQCVALVSAAAPNQPAKGVSCPSKPTTRAAPHRPPPGRMSLANCVSTVKVDSQGTLVAPVRGSVIPLIWSVMWRGPSAPPFVRAFFVAALERPNKKKKKIEARWSCRSCSAALGVCHTAWLCSEMRGAAALYACQKCSTTRSATHFVIEFEAQKSCAWVRMVVTSQVGCKARVQKQPTQHRAAWVVENTNNRRPQLARICRLTRSSSDPWGPGPAHFAPLGIFCMSILSARAPACLLATGHPPPTSSVVPNSILAILSLFMTISVSLARPAVSFSHIR